MLSFLKPKSSNVDPRVQRIINANSGTLNFSDDLIESIAWEALDGCAHGSMTLAGDEAEIAVRSAPQEVQKLLQGLAKRGIPVWVANMGGSFFEGVVGRPLEGDHSFLIIAIDRDDRFVCGVSEGNGPVANGIVVATQQLFDNLRDKSTQSSSIEQEPTAEQNEVKRIMGDAVDGMSRLIVCAGVAKSDGANQLEIMLSGTMASLDVDGIPMQMQIDGLIANDFDEDWIRSLASAAGRPHAEALALETMKTLKKIAEARADEWSEGDD